jgi:hypothetical protein
VPKKNTRQDVFKQIDMRGGDITQCWPWKGNMRKGKLSELRPIFKCQGEEWYAYRLVWILYNGRELQQKEYIRHTCDNSACCNPHHLLIGTQKDNVQDAMDRERHGHKRVDIQKIMQLLEIGMKSQDISDYMRTKHGCDMHDSMIRRIKRREHYAHIPWPWGDEWAAANRTRLASISKRDIVSNRQEEGDDA